MSRNLFELCYVRGASMLEAALIYAALGWAVFPCIGKQPAIANGFHASTTDTVQLREWWTKWPNANIGLPIPHGWWALDVDGPVGEATLLQLIRTNGALPLTLAQLTGSGGQHRVFVGDARQAARFAPGLDTRVAGKGYIIAAPSIHPTTRRVYRWSSIAAPVDAPDWLMAMVAPINIAEPTPYAPPPRGTALATRRERYAQGALSRIAAEIAATTEGNRNSALNSAWYRLGRFADVLSKDDARSTMLEAARAAGLSDVEALKVLR